MRNILTGFGVVDPERQVSTLLRVEHQIEDIWRASDNTQEDVENQREWTEYLHHKNVERKEENIQLRAKNAQLRVENAQLRDDVRELKVVTAEHLS